MGCIQRYSTYPTCLSSNSGFSFLLVVIAAILLLPLPLRHLLDPHPNSHHHPCRHLPNNESDVRLCIYHRRVRKIVLKEHVMLYHLHHLPLAGPFPYLIKVLACVCLRTVSFNAFVLCIPLPYVHRDIGVAPGIVVSNRRSANYAPHSGKINSKYNNICTNQAVQLAENVQHGDIISGLLSHGVCPIGK